jgi:D-methionine transport system ATP-binding protein
MIELRNLTKNYQTQAGAIQALRDINLRVQAGEIFGVIGKSGAGKSTLIRCVNLLERPTQGTVVVADSDLTALSAAELRQARHQIGMIFQHFNLLSQRTVYQNIALPLELIGHNKKQIDIAVMPLLELTGLSDKKNNYPAELSGGQKQRVAIARALASQPKVLLSDEATSALDPHTTKTILQLLKDINIQLGITILLITHEIEVIKQICDRVALIHEGEIIEQDEIYNFFTQPKTVLAQETVKSALKQELPEIVQKQLQAVAIANSKPVLRIIFHGRAAAEPLIARLMQDFGITMNILQANIEFLKQDALGIMVTEIVNNADKLPQAIAYLQQHGVNAEIIGYIEKNV